jgi:hypothetical protein
VGVSTAIRLVILHFKYDAAMERCALSADWTINKHSKTNYCHLTTFAYQRYCVPAQVLLLTPPFTQLNTPYPATAYLKGFLNTLGVSSHQSDMGLEVILQIFSKKGLSSTFEKQLSAEATPNAARIYALGAQYITTIDPVVCFLQGKAHTLAHRICSRNWLPEAGRFELADADLVANFGIMGLQDKAKHLATLYLEDLADYITEQVDPYFGFSRYAERMGRSANTFDELYEALQADLSFTDERHIDVLAQKMYLTQPSLVAMSVPFPGNLYSAFRAAQFIKTNYPDTKIAMGGGFPNTEFRELRDRRVFEFFDFITLDDGEAPIEQLLNYISGRCSLNELKRTYCICDGQVTYMNSSSCKDYQQNNVGTPDYSDLLIDKYISVIEVANPMHSLWSDGFWNKLTMAHGCYWGKCTFCDTTLDYIGRYEPLTAQLLCNRIEEVMAQTGKSGFHFVDEAAPPALMRELALEIIRRKLVITWWTNIRFEKSFTRDLCLLLRASGCVAVSGGLEVASDRLLALIQKGITVAQVAKVNQHFTEAGIMVHAYLMYGFPTQTNQETIDSLEMVRQLFATGVLKSAFWHQFALTVHSPVGKAPALYGVTPQYASEISFASNDVLYSEATGIDHSVFGEGLRKSLYNYMHGACLDYPLQKWFEFKVPKTTVPANYIEGILNEAEYQPIKPTAKVVWLGLPPTLSTITKSKKGATWELAQLTFRGQAKDITIQVTPEKGAWLAQLLSELSNQPYNRTTVADIMHGYETQGWDDFELFWHNKPINTLYKVGLLTL